MSDNKLETKQKVHLRIITPVEVKVDQDVDLVIMRTITGDLGVLPRHEMQLCVLDDGFLRMMNGRKEQTIAVFGGMAEITGTSVTILTDEAHWPEDVDRDETQKSKEHLERKMQEQTDTREFLRTELMLKRMLMKLDLSQYPTVDDFNVED